MATKITNTEKIKDDRELTLVDKDLYISNDNNVSENRLSLPKTPFSDNIVLQMLQRTPEDKIKHRQGAGGMIFDYVKGSYAKKVLNYTFGFLWNSKVVRSENILDKNGNLIEIVVDVECTFSIWDDKINAYNQIVKTQSGGAKVKYNKTTGLPVSVANDRKAAITDAVKKCASELGFFSDVYASDDYREIDEDLVQEIKEDTKTTKTKKTKKIVVEVENSTPKNEPEQEEKEEDVKEVEEKNNEPQIENKQVEPENVEPESDSGDGKRIEEVYSQLTPEEIEVVKKILSEGSEMEKNDITLIMTNGLEPVENRLKQTRDIISKSKFNEKEVPTACELLQEEIVGEEEVEKITKAQHDKLFALWTELCKLLGKGDEEINNREFRMRQINHILQVADGTFKSTSDLTKEQASTVIDVIQNKVDTLIANNPSI